MKRTLILTALILAPACARPTPDDSSTGGGGALTDDSNDAGGADAPACFASRAWWSGFGTSEAGADADLAPSPVSAGGSLGCDGDTCSLASVTTTTDPALTIKFTTPLRIVGGAVDAFSATLPSNAVTVTLDGVEDPDNFISPSLVLTAASGQVSCVSADTNTVRCTLTDATLSGAKSDGTACAFAFPALTVEAASHL